MGPPVVPFSEHARPDALSAMLITVYNASWETMGGGEKYLCMLADTLSREPGATVRILLDREDVTAGTLRAFFNIPLDRIEFVRVKPADLTNVLSDTDLSVVQTNFRPFKHRAPRQVYILHVPYGPLSSGRIAHRIATGRVREAAKDAVRMQLLRTVRKADLVIVNSEFCREAYRRHHTITASCLYASIDDFLRPEIKHPVILSVGRFFRGLYNDKRYDVMIEAFRTLCTRHPDRGWTYRIAGSCGSDPDSQAFLENLRARAAGLPVEFHVNQPYALLVESYNTATVFWHGAGYGVDESRYPEQMEHFGMTTVEAMSARCVPVVFRGGGQKEVLQEDTSGLFWITPGDLVRQTERLAADPVGTARLADGARKRALEFSADRFVQRTRQLFHHLLTGTNG
jgi:glycosyltransferase involved in cell wall biosynthesis